MATGRAEGAAVADAAEDRDLVLLEAHPGAPAVAEPAAGQLVLHRLLGDGQAGRQALDDDDEGPAVRLTRREEPEHAQRYWPALRGRNPFAVADRRAGRRGLDDAAP